jgi:hypothetical protein
LVGWQEVCRIIEIFNYLYVSGNLGNTDILYYYFFLRPSVCTSAASSTTEASTTRWWGARSTRGDLPFSN